MRIRKWIAVSLTLALTATLFGCGLKSPDASSTAQAGTSASQTTGTTGAGTAGKTGSAQVTLTYAEVNSLDSLDGQLAAYFKQKVEEKSGGSVAIDIQASGVLGAEADVLDGMTTGGSTVSLARISCFALNSSGAKLSSLLSLPYTFSSRDHFWKFTESDLGQKVLDEPNTLGLGLKGLYFQEEGFRDFFFKKEVKGIEDLKNRKIRVSNDPILTNVVSSLGASPTVISFNELYTSLQSGVVDGADQPIALYESNAFNEVAPYLLEDRHTLSSSEVIVTNDAWNKLTQDQQKAIQEAGKETSAHARELSQKVEDQSKTELEAKGVNFVEVTDVKPWRDACQSITAQYTKGLEKEYQQILDLGK